MIDNSFLEVITSLAIIEIFLLMACASIVVRVSMIANR